MADFLISKGGLVYLPDMPDFLTLSIPPAGSQFEIVEIDFKTGKEYDQLRYVCRKTAESLVRKYPDCWEIVSLPTPSAIPHTT